MPIRPWKVLASRYLVQDRWMTLRSDRCETGHGIIVDPYYVLEGPDWVHAVAFNGRGEMLLIRQYRHGNQRLDLELPCGCVDKGELPLDAMKRELMEETGCIAETFEAFPVLSANPARYSTRVFGFLALGTTVAGAPRPDEAEQIEHEFVPVSEVLRLINTGELQQPLHIASIFLALQKLGRLSVLS